MWASILLVFVLVSLALFFLLEPGSKPKPKPRAKEKEGDWVDLFLAVEQLEDEIAELDKAKALAEAAQAPVKSGQKKKRQKRQKPSLKPLIKIHRLAKKTNKCGVCLAHLTPGYVVCKDCHTVSHRDCVEELMDGCCPGIGCRKALIKRNSA